MKERRGTMSPSPRQAILLAALLAAAFVYVASGGWRQRLMEESAHSRQVIAAVEAARSAREQQAGRQRELEALVRERPDDVEARLELAQLRWAEAGPQAAVMVLDSGETRVRDARALLLLAAAQRELGREDRALEALDRAAVVAPANGDVRAERAMLFSLLGWFPQAGQALREAEQHGADPRRVALVRATMARQQGDLRAARSALAAAGRAPGGEPSVARGTDDAEVRRQLAAVAEAEGQVAEAITLLESLAPSESDPEVWVALARLYLRRGDPAGQAAARAALQQALALRPAMPAARLLLGRCLRLSGEREEARALLERFHRERPQHGAAAFELAQLYRDLGMTDRVAPLMAEYRESLRRREVMRRAAMAVMAHPDRASAHLAVGRLCRERDMIGRAILSLERALALDPRLAAAREELAQARRAPATGASREE